MPTTPSNPQPGRRPLRLTALFPLLALALIFLWLPETNGRELEDTSRVAGT